MQKHLKSKYLGHTSVVDGNGQIMNAQVVQKDVPHNYWKVSVENLIANLGDMTPKSMYVVDYVLRHTDYNTNMFAGTNADIAKKCDDVGYTKVATTLSFLASHNVITRKPGRIMWNPKILNHKRIKNEVPGLIIQYRVMNHEYKSIKSPAERNKERTAHARKALALKRNAKKLRHHSTKNLKLYPTKAEAIKHNGYFQPNMLKKNKRASQN